MKDFFISYNKADKDWAEWVAWVLEESGYSVIIQAWDFRPGGNFVLEMQKAAGETQKTVAVLSENYLSAEYTNPEWANALARDPQGQARALIPIRVEECTPTGLLNPVIYVDLVGLSERDARIAILGAFSDRAKPTQPPSFPGASLGVNQPRSGRVTRSPVQYPNSSRQTAALPAWTESPGGRGFPRRQQIILSGGEKRELVKSLLQCPSMNDRNARDTVVKNLGNQIASTVPRHLQNNVDVMNIIDSCLNFPGGLEALIEAVRLFDEETEQMQALEAVLSRVLRGKT